MRSVVREAAFANEGVVSVGEDGQIGPQAGRLRRAFHPLEIDGAVAPRRDPEADVLGDRR